ncbi:MULTISPECIES: TetR/AcrR family transcriptional regulator [Bacillaceae]|uniref:TetR/AcrR family transcriptional regulator n=1 Tax=Metabacillus sediminis TaxID=3117746 RepID=A0ABZ2NH82_9BACI|nr:TetR/AcrR family transcriptional regulator [Bacillus sp. SJS]KZZ83831.1 TetR family transcriptional regulator [Bacillus sp. SJS]
MARSKEFDTVAVLRKAAEVFGQLGYQGASLPELLKHLEIGRQSLYDTFGTKKDLFLSAVKTYLEAKNELVIARLKEAGSVKEAVRDIFAEGIQALKDPESATACYIINSAVEQLPFQEELANYFSQQSLLLENAFYEALVRGKQEGEFTDRHGDLRSLARYLNQSRLSLTFIAKTNKSFNALESYAKVSLSVLD